MNQGGSVQLPSETKGRQTSKKELQIALRVNKKVFIRSMCEISIKHETYNVTTDIITSDLYQIVEAEFSVSNKTGPCPQYTNRSLP